ncbi:MAG: class I SAM-dependent methyltransferase [Chitinivibrionales bacterium]|nr:class I SAM-dependent methyltransferase [Chitinivibrionales bacterium]
MKTCRACGHKLHKPFLSLGNSPLSNSFLSSAQLGVMEPYFPLDLHVCPSCFLVQLDVFEAPRLIFSAEYAYFSSYSDSWLAHCKEYTAMMIDRFAITPAWSVVEIASNDGYLLQYFKERGIPVLGIEPAQRAAHEALRKGIPTETVYFTDEYARTLSGGTRGADLIIGNNVLAHNPDLNDFTAGLKTLLKPSGIITLEFPHVLRMLQSNEFDTIYHEHFSYLSFYSVKLLFEHHGLTMFDADEIATHGGSLRIYARHKENDALKVSPHVEQLIEKEKSAGLLDTATYMTYKAGVEKVKRDLLAFLIKQKNEHKKIVGYGAPAKGNTLLNYCGIRTDFIDFTVDRSPFKQGKFLPGTHIPILHPDAIIKAKPDYLFILPWNIRDEIMEQMKDVRQWGCKFVIATPKLEIIP